MSEILFYDNRWVRTWAKHRGAEYVCLFISPTEIIICRYCVPGRLDSYSFKYGPDERTGLNKLHYFSDMRWSLKKASAQVQADLKKPQIKRMLKEADKVVNPLHGMHNRLNVVLEMLK